MKRTFFLAFLVAMASFAALSSPLTFTSDFNVLVLDSMSATNSSIAGSVAVGGNATFASMSIANGNNGSTGLTPASGPDALNLVVGGDLKWTNGTLYNGSGIYGGDALLKHLGVSNGSINTGEVPVDFSSLAKSAQAASSQFAAMDANGSTTFLYGGITLQGTEKGLNVFAIDGSMLGSAHTVAIHVPEGASVLINIVGVASSFQNAGLTLNGNAFNSGKNASLWSELLWNFESEGTFNVQGVNFAGSLLAPNASVTLKNSNFNGQVVAGKLTTNGAINNFSFNGTVRQTAPPLGEDLETSAVPEPGTLLLAGLGLLLLMAGNARRKVAMAKA
ncbi:MAG: choice-of-anchor A family protein [Bryobacterales bacterium]|nr:choice-of-anchor A family protein [Bryobacterales bacterium]